MRKSTEYRKAGDVGWHGNRQVLEVPQVQARQICVPGNIQHLYGNKGKDRVSATELNICKQRKDLDSISDKS